MKTTLSGMVVFENDLMRVGGKDHLAIFKQPHGLPRPRDLGTFEKDGITFVLANQLGVSFCDYEYLLKLGMSGWFWKFREGTTLPPGLILRPDPDPRKKGHYFLSPSRTMRLSEFRYLIESLTALGNRSDIKQKANQRDSLWQTQR